MLKPAVDFIRQVTSLTRQTAEREREMQQIRLENNLLRFERGLPPGSVATEDDRTG
jgi:hypothetical protein